MIILNINLSAIVTQAQYDEDLTQEERDDFIALNSYLGLVSPGASPGNIDIVARISANIMNDFVNTLGWKYLPEAERPKAKKSDIDVEEFSIVWLI